MRQNRAVLFRIYACSFLIFLYAPLLLLPIFSFNDSIYIVFPFRGFTLRWYEELFTNNDLVAALLNSVLVASAVSVVSTTLSVMAAIGLTRFRVLGGNYVIGAVLLPLIIPGIVMAISLLILIRKMFDLELSLFTVGVSHILVCLPFTLLTMLTRFRDMDPNLREASLNLGETPWVTFWRVTFPLILPGVISSLLLSFTVSFDEIVLALFLHGEALTLPVYIFGQLRFPAKLPEVLALGSCILLLSGAFIFAAQASRKYGTKT